MHEETRGSVAREYAVVIAGGGPTGLMLAAELALARVDVAIVERREDQELAGSRAGGLHPRAIEVLDQRGVAERFIAQGQPFKMAPFGRTTFEIGDMPSRHSYYLAIWQNQIERILADWVAELSVPTYRKLDVVDFAQDQGGVDVKLSDERWIRAKYLVGCDGGRSVIRKKAGIEFAGWDASRSYLIAEAEWAQEPAWGMRHDAHGSHALAKRDGQGVRMVLCERQLQHGDAPTLDDVRQALIAAYGTDYGIHNATWISRFSDMARQAAAYRDRRVLLAGDAAHVHSPIGGQGLNIGVQDAVNLGWKLAEVVHGTAPDSLLDSYHAERHPVGARALRNTMALTALDRTDDRVDALRDLVVELLRAPETRKHYFAMLTGLDIRYDLGAGHPLLGRRMPDLDLITARGPERVYALLHEARPVLLNLGATGELDIAPWAERVRAIDARYEGAWELPAVGAVAAPAAVLIRPDGYVAWVGDGADRGLHDALARWLGPAAAR